MQVPSQRHGVHPGTLRMFAICTVLAVIISGVAMAQNSPPPVSGTPDKAVFNQDQTILLRYPRDKKGSYVIPASVTTIWLDAFSRCDGLTEVTIPTSVTHIESPAFSDCPSLTAIHVDAANPNFSSEDGVLFDKNQTVLIRYPAARTGSYVMPASVTEMWTWPFAFSGSTGLTSLTISAGVTNIVNWTFDGCNRLTGITVHAANLNYRSVDGVLFNRKQTGLIRYPNARSGSYAIPPSVTTIWGNAFSRCAGLTNVTIPASITLIGMSSFEGCTNLPASLREAIQNLARSRNPKAPVSPFGTEETSPLPNSTLY